MGIHVMNTYLPMQQENQTEYSEELTTSRGLVDKAIDSEHIVLGKVFLLAGSEVSRNQTGLKLHNCVCEIDEDYTTKIYDNRSMQQVVITSAEQAVATLQGFTEAI